MGGACRTHGLDEKCIQYFGCNLLKDCHLWKRMLRVGRLVGSDDP